MAEVARPGLDTPEPAPPRLEDAAASAAPLLDRALPRLQRLAHDLYGGEAPPPVGLLRQRLDVPRLTDLDGTVEREVRGVLARSDRPPRGPIAVGVGSRGIANLARITRTAVATLRAAGYEPFIVPAMGSHGASTAEGQAQVLTDYGIDAAPIRATMETVVIGDVDGGVPVHMDRYAVEAGNVFLVSRIKPHTDFRGRVESGLSKMCAIGLGKQLGARQMHAAGTYGLRQHVPLAARLAAERGLLLGGLAIVENSRDETARVQGVLGSEVAGPVEEGLLAQARALLPRIPFDQLDVLVIDRMGKDISGTGMDTNVIGRLQVPGEEDPPAPRITNIAVLDLTPASHGNAAGLGLADFISARLLAKVDLVAFYTNCLTAGIVGIKRAQIPLVLPTDRDAVLAAIAARGRSARDPLRLAWIADTLHTESLAVSEALWEEARQRNDLERLVPPRAMPFDAAGTLSPLPAFA